MKITVDISGSLKALTDLQQKQLPFAAARALTRMAQSVAKAEQDEMRKVFDRPTPKTLASVRVTPATKQKLEAAVFIDTEAVKGTAPDKYLYPEIFGGPRGLKRSESLLRRSGLLGSSEYMVPSRYIALDQYGNVPKGTMTRVLSGVRAFLAAGYNQNRTKKWRRGKIGKAGPWTGGYFVVSRKTGQPRTHSRPLPNGIWQRSRDNETIRPLFFFVRQPVYRKRFKFFDVAAQRIREEWDRIFASSLEDALRTAR